MLHFPIRFHLKYTLQAHTARDFQRRLHRRGSGLHVALVTPPGSSPGHSGCFVDNRLGQGRREAQLPSRASIRGLGNGRDPCETQGKWGRGEGRALC